MIADRPAAAVLGGAGTGKSVLAFHEARRRSESGEQVLLLCYNHLLGAHLARMCQGTRIRTMTLHQMYEWWVDVVDMRHGRNLIAEAERGLPGAARDVTLPAAFVMGISLRTPPAFTSVVLDEGQDLIDEDWLAIDTLRGKLGARLLVFRDTNQALRRKTDYLPVSEESWFRLRQNCRNTHPVHESVYRFYQGPPISTSAILGPVPSVTPAPTRLGQAAAVRDRVHTALGLGVPTTEVVVLVLAKDDFKSAYFRELAPLDPMFGASWGLGQHMREGSVMFDCVARFKGLEATVLVLWIGDDVDVSVHREWLYVGMSRSKAELHVVGTEAGCRAALVSAPRAP